MARSNYDNIFAPDMCMDYDPDTNEYVDRETGLRYNHDTRCVWKEQTRKWVKITGAAAKEIPEVTSNVCLEHPRDPKRNPFNAKDHQISALKRFQNIFDSDDPSLKGLLVMHGLGSGKTCTYAMCADYYLNNVPAFRQNVYIFTSGALRSNFIQQYCSYCGKTTKDLLERFHFYSHNSSSIKETLERQNRLTPGFLNNSLIIIDEVHNVINGRVHESDQKTAVYELIANSTDSYIVCGSGTPLVGDYKELFYLIRFLRPGIIDTLNDFKSLFSVINDIIVPINLEELQEFLNPVVDHYTALGDLSHYPKVITKYVNIPINPARLNNYIATRIDEIRTPPPREQDKLYNPAKYARQRKSYFLALSMLKSRQESNFQYPEIQLSDRLGTPIQLRVPDRILDAGGWITTELISLLPEYGEKITYILSDILNHNYKHVIYTKFKEHYGSYLIGALLDLYGIGYRFFNGDMNDNDRIRVLAEFNSIENIRGQRVKVMIITDAGAEGINLFQVRKFHILEQYISHWIIKQAIGRAIRYDSHAALPIPDRNVTIMNYMLDLGQGLDYNLYYSSDYKSLAFGLAKEKSISFLLYLLAHLNNSPQDNFTNFFPNITYFEETQPPENEQPIPEEVLP